MSMKSAFTAMWLLALVLSPVGAAAASCDHIALLQNFSGVDPETGASIFDVSVINNCACTAAVVLSCQESPDFAYAAISPPDALNPATCELNSPVETGTTLVFTYIANVEWPRLGVAEAVCV